MLTKAEARRVALSLPGATEGLFFRKPAIFVQEQFLTRIHDKEDAVVIITDGMEMRDMMLEAEPELFYITPHYRNWPTVLARLGKLNARTLKSLLAPRLKRIQERPAPKKRAAKKPDGKPVRKIAKKKKAR